MERGDDQNSGTSPSHHGYSQTSGNSDYDRDLELSRQRIGLFTYGAFGLPINAAHERRLNSPAAAPWSPSPAPSQGYERQNGIPTTLPETPYNPHPQPREYSQPWPPYNQLSSIESRMDSTMPSTLAEPPSLHTTGGAVISDIESPADAHIANVANTSQPRRSSQRIFWGTILGTEGGPHNIQIRDDTGTMVNWVHPDVVRRCHLKVKSCQPHSFQCFTGQRFTASQYVQMTWAGREDRSYEGDFIVSPAATDIQVVLGEDFVDRHGRAVDICSTEQKIRDAHLFVQTKITNKEAKAIQKNQDANEQISEQLSRRSMAGYGDQSRRRTDSLKDGEKTGVHASKGKGKAGSSSTRHKDAKR